MAYLILITIATILLIRFFPRSKKATGATLYSAGPLSVEDPLREELFSNLQGNILSGHGRNFSAHVFISFSRDQKASRAWLKSLAGAYATSFKDQQQSALGYRSASLDGGLFGHLALSARGYLALGFKEPYLPRGLSVDPLDRNKENDVFLSGMKGRARYLLDPSIDEWETPFQEEIHLLLLLASDNRAELEQALTRVLEDASQNSMVVHTVERGETLLKQLDPEDPQSIVHVEHFGYVDGRSQPLFLEEQLEKERASGGISNWDPTAPLNLVLVTDPFGRTENSYGSFLVYRKLEQNIRGFKNATRQLAGELGISPELAGAMAVGRFKDGTPVVLEDKPGRTDVPNNFDFSQDPQGRRCPFHSHIRKTNPRGEAVGFETGDESLEMEKRHRIARRGIPYGGPLQESDDPENLTEEGSGLLFLCYQSDIREQFEFIQRRWSNNPYFLQPQKDEDSDYDKTGLDPLIGQPHPTSPNAARAPENWPGGWGKETVKVDTSFAGFVKMLGGEYFFAPSLSFFEYL